MAMTPGAALAVAIHLFLCLLIAYLGQFAVGFAENVTDAELSVIGRDASLTLLMLGLAIAWSVCLCFRRWMIAAVAFIAECVLGLIVLPPWLDTSAKSDWVVYAVAATVALTGIWALIAMRPTAHRLVPPNSG